MKKVDYSVSLEALTGLRAIPTTVMQRLLNQHGTALREAGLDPGALVGADDLWSHRERLPAALLDAVHAILDMADDAGHDQLLATLGGPLFVADSAGEPPVVFAAHALVDHPALFAQALGQRFVESIRRCREFPGKLVLEPKVDQARVDALSARLAAFFSLRQRGRFCRVRWWDEAAGLCFLVSHGGVRRMDDAVQEDQHGSREVTLPWRPRYHDLVVFDPRTGRLRVSAADAQTTQAYVREFGETLTGDRHWFGNGAVVSLDPLFTARHDALRPTRGILEVRLVELEVGSWGEDGGSFVVSGENAFRTLDRMKVDPVAFGELRTAKFRIKFASDRKVRAVTLGIPDRVSGDWRRDGGVVRPFFEERGFLAGPTGEPTCQVA